MSPSVSPSGASDPVTLDNCDQEPIHIPGAVQPHGVLLAFDLAEGRIAHVSRSAEGILGTRVEQLLGSQIDSLFPKSDISVRAQLLEKNVVDSRPVYLSTVAASGGSFDAIAHRIGPVGFLELEPARKPELSAPELYRMVQQAFAQIQRATSLVEMAATCAQQIRQISGFDRVMVYRFDQDWNGQVIAEERQDDLEPFLGLHYPASDIPRQARELYTRNWLRFIADRDYVPSPIISAADAPQPLDLSHAVLRSVSPIHLQYLRNMGVRASMSISLLRDGKLWGLVACHHYQSSRFVPYDVRTASELLGQFMSVQLAAVEERELSGARAAATQAREQVLANIEKFEDLSRALVEARPNMLDIIEADGAAVVSDGRVDRIGQTPGEDEIRSLTAWFANHAQREVFATDHLQSMFGSALLGSVAAGVLALSLSGARSYTLIWFRTERLRTVDWAGDPSKSIQKGDGVGRLSPRGSFALWKQIVKGRSAPWTAAELDAAHQIHDGLMRLLLRRSEALAAAHANLRLANEEREKALESERAARSEAERLNRMKDDFVATLSHELRTPLNAILGWAQILVRRRGMTPDVTDGLSVIERNARSQAQMIGDLLDISRIISGKLRLDLQHTHLPTLVETSIETVALAAAAKEIRIEKMLDPMVGLQTTGDPGRLQQVIWNLLSNAVKFTPKGGKIQVILQRVESHVELSIIDSGQGISPEELPYIFERFRQADGSASRRHGGLGLGLSIARNLIELHGGTIRAFSAGIGRGSSFVISMPVQVLQRLNDGSTATALPDTHRLPLAGVRVLVVDDEPDSRKLIAQILEECDSQVKTASSKDEAIELLRKETFDVLISDIGMPAADGYSLIREWRAIESQLGRKRLPALALTAYVRAEDRRRSILAGFQAHMGKPVESGELLAQVASLAGRV
jgi:light-regulated signal transduction histidine kinase (bacteriophytochrome)